MRQLEMPRAAEPVKMQRNEQLQRLASKVAASWTARASAPRRARRVRGIRGAAARARRERGRGTTTGGAQRRGGDPGLLDKRGSTRRQARRARAGRGRVHRGRAGGRRAGRRDAERLARPAARGARRCSAPPATPREARVAELKAGTCPCNVNGNLTRLVGPRLDASLGLAAVRPRPWLPPAPLAPPSSPATRAPPSPPRARSPFE